MPQRNKTPEQQAREQEYQRQRYLDKKEYFLAKRQQQTQREAEDRALAAQGDAAAQARVERVRQLRNANDLLHRRKQGVLPAQEMYTRKRAVKELLAPLRKAAQNRRNRSKDQLRRVIERLARQGDTVAQERIAGLKTGRQRYAEWYERTKQKAATGDEEALFALWKMNANGQLWRKNQKAAGLSTTLQDLDAAKWNAIRSKLLARVQRTIKQPINL